METKIDRVQEIKQAKSALRKKIKAQIADFAFDSKKIREANKKISDYFLQSKLYKNASLIFCFISCTNEVDTEKIIFKSLDDNKKVVVPKVISNSNKMEFYYLQNIPLKNQTQLGMYDILEPKENLIKLDIQKLSSLELQASVLIFPGLAFDKTGNRLGKGKGFYDVFFENATFYNKNFCNFVKRVGICYFIQLTEKIPTEKNDIKMQFLITENGIIECC